MNYFVITVLPWIPSTIAVVTQFMAGCKYKSAWVITLFSQGLWMWWIIVSKQYGFIPLNICMSIVAIRNFRKWFLEEVEEDVDIYRPYEDTD